MNSLTKKAISHVKKLNPPTSAKWGIYCTDRREFAYGISEPTEKEAFEVLRETLGVETLSLNFTAREVVL